MRFMVNLAISTFLIFVFGQVGWLTFLKELMVFDSVAANQILVCAVIALIFSVVNVIIGAIYMLVILVTCGLGCLLFPLYYILLGTISFAVIELLVPGWVVAIDDNWIKLLMILLLVLIRIPSVTVTATKTEE